MAAADTVVKAGKSFSISLLLPRIAISLVFAFAALGKLFDLGEFQRSLASIEWISTSFLLPSAILLILAELIAAVLLWPRCTLKAGAILSAALSLVFTLYTAQRLLIGASTDCACFGVFLRLNPWAMLPIDSALLLASLAVLRLAWIGPIPKAVAKTDSEA